MSRRRQHATPCPTATKWPYSTEAEALADLKRITAEPDPMRRKLPSRVYLCACRHWHLTSVVHYVPLQPETLDA